MVAFVVPRRMMPARQLSSGATPSGPAALGRDARQMPNQRAIARNLPAQEVHPVSQHRKRVALDARPGWIIMHLQRRPTPRRKRRVGGGDADRRRVNRAGAVIDQACPHQVGRRAPDHRVQRIRRARILTQVIIHALRGPRVIRIIVREVEPDAVDGVAIGRNGGTQARVGAGHSGAVGWRGEGDRWFAAAGTREKAEAGTSALAMPGPSQASPRPSV